MNNEQTEKGLNELRSLMSQKSREKGVGTLKFNSYFCHKIPKWLATSILR